MLLEIIDTSGILLSIIPTLSPFSPLFPGVPFSPLGPGVPLAVPDGRLESVPFDGGPGGPYNVLNIDCYKLMTNYIIYYQSVQNKYYNMKFIKFYCRHHFRNVSSVLSTSSG
jgi:hypothetical protein